MNTNLTGFAPVPDAARAARMALRSGNFEAAKQLYRLHLARHPGNADALLAISALFREEGKIGVANEFMLRAFAAKPLSAETAGGGKPLGKPVQRLWLQSMTPQAIRDGFAALRAALGAIETALPASTEERDAEVSLEGGHGLGQGGLGDPDLVGRRRQPPGPDPRVNVRRA